MLGSRKPANQPRFSGGRPLMYRRTTSTNNSSLKRESTQSLPDCGVLESSVARAASAIARAGSVQPRGALEIQSALSATRRARPGLAKGFASALAQVRAAAPSCALGFCPACLEARPATSRSGCARGRSRSLSGPSTKASASRLASARAIATSPGTFAAPGQPQKHPSSRHWLPMACASRCSTASKPSAAADTSPCSHGCRSRFRYVISIDISLALAHVISEVITVDIL